MAPKQNEAVLTAVKETNDLIKELVGVLKPKDVPITPTVDAPSVNVHGTVDSKFPIPYEYREVVDTVLNRKFGIDIDYVGGAFNFSVLVPKEYSNAGEPHWQSYHEDRRTKNIDNALGTSGVRDWVTKIYDNLSPEIRSQITQDRAKL